MLKEIQIHEYLQWYKMDISVAQHPRIQMSNLKEPSNMNIHSDRETVIITNV